MEQRQIVLDTNVLIAALRSRRGASCRLLSLVGAGADTLVTFNLKDFAGTETFGLRAVTPQVFLQEIGER